MRTLAAFCAVAFLLAGCTSGGDDTTTSATTGPATCGPDERLVPATASAPASCKPLRQPQVSLTAAEPSTSIYRKASFTWAIDPGDYTEEAHAMLTSLRLSTASRADADALDGPGSYGTEVAKREHQGLPMSATTDYTFTTPGTYYLRAYGSIQSKGRLPKDTWSPEVTITVTDIQPTGNTTTVTHPVGNAAGKLAPASVDLHLGDALVFKNDDATEHKFTPRSCAEFTEAVTVPMQSSSQPLVFKAPGTCLFDTDDVQAQTLTVNVAAG